MGLLDEVESGNSKIILVFLSLLGYVMFSDIIETWMESVTPEARAIFFLFVLMFIYAFTREGGDNP